MSDYMDSLYENLNEESLAAITAGAGYNDGANNGFWRIQPRLPKFREGAGQWMEMGAEIRAAFKKLGKIMSRAGRVVGSGGTSDTVRVLHPAEPERGFPEEIKIYPTSAVELIGARLSPEYLRSIGRDPNATGTGISAMSNPANLPNYEDLPTAPATEDDRRLAEQGTASPEGQEMSKFKDSPEGQEIARLEPESAAEVLDTPTEIAKLLEGRQQIGQLYQPDKTQLKLAEGFDFQPRTDLIPEEIESSQAMLDGSYWTMPFEDKVRIDRAISKKNGKTSIYDMSDEELADMAKGGKMTPSAMRARGEMARRGLIPEYRNLKGADENGNDIDFRKPVPALDKPRDLDAEIAKAEADAASMKEGSASDAAFDAAYAKIDRLKAERDRQKSKGVDVNEPVQLVDDEELSDLGFMKVTPGRGEFKAWESETGDGEMVRLSLDGMGRWQAVSSKYNGNNETGSWSEALDSGKHANVYDALEDSFARDMVDRVAEEKKLSDVQRSEIDAADLFQRAMDGENIDLDKIGQIDESKGDDILDEGDEGDEETGSKSFDDLEGPTDEDLADIMDEEPAFDEDADWNEKRRATERVGAYEVGPGDYILDQDGDVARVEDVEELPDGSLAFSVVNYDGGPENSFRVSPDGTLKKVSFDEPVDEEPEADTSTPTPAPATPAEPEYVPEPAPATARSGYDGSELEIGDEMFTNDGSKKLGNITAVRKKTDGSGKWEVRLEDDGSQLYGWWDVDNDTIINKPGGDKTPEVPAEPDIAGVPSPKDMEVGDSLPFRNTNDPKDDQWVKDALDHLDWLDEPKRYDALRSILEDSNLSKEEKLQKIADVMDRLGIFRTDQDHRLAGRMFEGRLTQDLAKAGFKKQPEPTAETPEAPEAPAAPEAPEAPEEPKVTKGGFKSKRVKGEKPKAPKKTVPEEKERPQEVPPPPADRVDDGGLVELAFADAVADGPRGPGGPDGDGGGGGLPPRMLSDKVLPQFDQFGNPLYLSDSNNKIIVDANGNPIALSDEEAFRGLIYEFYPNAKTTADGLRTILGRWKDGDDTVEISVSRSNGGRSLIEVRLTDAQGKTDRYLHYDVRESFAGLHGKTNSPQVIYNILTGKFNRKNAGKSTSAMGSARERLEYFRGQKRRASEGGKWLSVLSTPEELWDHYANGELRVINTSAGGRGRNKGTAEFTLRQRGLSSLWDAIDEGLATGNFDDAYYRARRFAGGAIPLDLDTLVEFRNWMVNELKTRYPNMPGHQRGTLATTVSQQLRKGVIETAERRERPFMSKDGSTPIRIGQWGYYENSDGVKSYGRVVDIINSVISDPTQSAEGDDFQYRDNITIEFAGGEVVSRLASKFFRVLDDPEERKRRKEGVKQTPGQPEVGTLTKYKPSPTGETRKEMRRLEVYGPGDGVSEDEYQAGLGGYGTSGEEYNVPALPTGNQGGGPVSGLSEGDMFFSKSGEPLGPVFGIQPITSKSGKAGFRIAYIDENGDVQTVNVAADEVRSPKS